MPNYRKPKDEYDCDDEHEMNCDEEYREERRPVMKPPMNKKDCDVCYPRHTLPKPVILECGSGGGFAFATNGTDVSVTSPCTACTPKTVGSVTIDTTCLCKPKTKVDFCCSILYDGRSDCSNLKLEFQLFRNCEGRGEEPLGSWYYLVEDQDDDFAQSFCLMFCDCSSCPSCCTYTVRCIPVELEDVTVCVNNCHISAIAQGNCD